MAMSVILIPAIFATLVVSNALISSIDLETPSSCPEQWSGKSLQCEVEEAKLEVARLESILGERVGEVNAKAHYFSDCEKKIEELDTEIDRLTTELSSSEHANSPASLKLSALEEEVRLLWAVSRKNNFEMYELEYKASDAERRLKQVTLQVEEMAEIVSEQWIQIQQLEQAVYMAELRTSKVRKELVTRCPFVKFFISLFSDCLEILKWIFEPYVPRVGSILVSCKSLALQKFEAAKHCHHQLQDLLMHAMESNEVTAPLAHQEVVFFVTSAMVAFPVMGACMLLLSQFS